MKKAFLFLMVLCLLSCSSFALALDDMYFGEWKFYSSSTHHHDSERNDSNRTIADAYKFGYHTNTITIHKDGTMEIAEKGIEPYTATWTETNEGSEYGDVPTLRVTRPDGSEGLFAFVDGMLRYALVFGTEEELFETTAYRYYKPELYELNADYVQNKALKLTAVYAETAEDYLVYTVHPEKLPDKEKLDCLVMLNEDMTAEVLFNYVPYEAVWKIEDLSICIELETGGIIRLEKQADGTFFGTLQRTPETYEYHVKFEQTDPFHFEEPLSLEQFKGTWALSHVHDALYFNYPLDKISFNMTLHIGDDQVTVDYVTSKGPEVWNWGLDIAGVPVLEDEHTGTALIFTNGSGYPLGTWLLKDGSLYMRMPGDTSYYFIRK